MQTAVVAIAAREGRRLTRSGIQDLSVLVIDHRTLTVIAYVGNHGGGDPHRDGAAVDVIQRPRSNGSLLKPFLYALMLQEGLLVPSTLVPDVPTNFAGYAPENFDRQHRGAVAASTALARSLNVPAVHMLREYGVERFHDQLQSLGKTSLFRPADDYGLALILGGSESTLWELAGMYANLAAVARDGERHRYRMPTLLVDTSSTAAAAYGPIDQGAAWLTLQALTDVVRPEQERAWQQFQSTQTVAWKTGTSFGLRDGWAIGSNGRYTVGVWTGNAIGEGVPALTGTTAAAPVMFEVFSLLGPTRWLEPPLGALKTVRVCQADGYLAAGDCPSRPEWAPRRSHFERVSPYYRQVHVDARGARVHAGCEAPAAMHGRAVFVLPPTMEYFWRLQRPDYQSLPSWREDCLASLADYTDDKPLDLIYPQEGARVLLPVDLDGYLGRFLLRAVHRDPAATVHWHLGGSYLGATRHFHVQEVSLEPGWHRLVLVDDLGRQQTRWFQVLAR
ncbi:penicillin-binding transpeptidase domain-containing protein [Alkalilimnicola ehrlichii]|uniref:penicillin-binding transpeptidase domain-containing protein n=1 Tax=Alkalilimnicola ehrlichii TaxID=351052 RepID=UPI001C6EEBD9|nr:penicillin-binding transpeptidase domain-containing protein [Alkalilimnicola ehrlichii]